MLAHSSFPQINKGLIPVVIQELEDFIEDGLVTHSEYMRSNILAIRENAMAAPKTLCERLDIELDKLSADDKVNLIGEIFEALTAQQLRQMRELADKKRLEKLDEAKAQLISEMRERFEQLDLNFEEELGLNRSRRRKSLLPPKYRSPDGQTWSGRGYPPQWIRDLEENGGAREDYIIKDEA